MARGWKVNCNGNVLGSDLPIIFLLKFSVRAEKIVSFQICITTQTLIGVVDLSTAKGTTHPRILKQPICSGHDRFTFEWQHTGRCQAAESGLVREYQNSSCREQEKKGIVRDGKDKQGKSGQSFVLSHVVTDSTYDAREDLGE